MRVNIGGGNAKFSLQLSNIGNRTLPRNDG